MRRGKVVITVGVKSAGVHEAGGYKLLPFPLWRDRIVGRADLKVGPIRGSAGGWRRSASSRRYSPLRGPRRRLLRGSRPVATHRRASSGSCDDDRSVTDHPVPPRRLVAFSGISLVSPPHTGPRSGRAVTSGRRAAPAHLSWRGLHETIPWSGRARRRARDRARRCRRHGRPGQPRRPPRLMRVAAAKTQVVQHANRFGFGPGQALVSREVYQDTDGLRDPLRPDLSRSDGHRRRLHRAPHALRRVPLRQRYADQRPAGEPDAKVSASAAAAAAAGASRYAVASTSTKLVVFGGEHVSPLAWQVNTAGTIGDPRHRHLRLRDDRPHPGQVVDGRHGAGRRQGQDGVLRHGQGQRREERRHVHAAGQQARQAEDLQRQPHAVPGRRHDLHRHEQRVGRPQRDQRRDPGGRRCLRPRRDVGLLPQHVRPRRHRRRRHRRPRVRALRHQLRERVLVRRLLLHGVR